MTDDFAKHQAALREGQRHVLRQRETEPLPDPVRRTVLWRWIAAAVVAVGIIATVRGVYGAERFNPGPHEIVITYAGKDYDADRRNILVLGQPFDSREECLNAIVRVKILVSGARLRCLAVETRRVR